MRRLLALLYGGLLISFTGILPVWGQSSYDLYGSARSSALGHSTTALSSAVGVHANPASAAAHQQRTLSFYARQDFRLSILRYASAFGSWPASWGVMSTGASTFGSDVYRETHLSVGYGRRLPLGTTRFVSAGLRARLYHTSIEGYGNARTVGLHLGLLVPLLSSLHLGAHATNVNGPSLTTNEVLPQTLAVGLGYRASSQILVLADVLKDIAVPASVRGGIEVSPVSSLTLRTGVTTAPVRFTGGAGIRLNQFQADIAAEQHPELGWSPSATLQIYW